MKHFYTLLLLFVANAAFSQFVHMRPGEEAPEQVELVMNDNTSRIGNVKNNRADKIALRILSQDTNAFRHASVEVEYIQFKPEGSEIYEKIPAEKIKKIVFLGEDPETFDRINVYKFKKKTLEVDRENVAYMFQTAKVDDVFKVYSNLYFGTRGAASQFNYFAKLRDSNETYYFNMSVGYLPRIFPLFKIFAPKNERYTNYIDKLRDKKSDEYKEFDKLRNEQLEKINAYLKENKKSLDFLEKESIKTNGFYNFLFYFMGKKLEQFSN
ncbi:hypothetical protein SAMN02927937_02524 [Paenimyroides aquimaris]|uniref:DUF4369 domain-containing protein n=1 Tax=Paenimyroides marinum TaxID=1159016 RepID=A0A1H6MIE3_9FLAO|nr:hypothetical protein [Paenimyroides aquimaris]SEH98165.1 hypothetical protein SAMN02927937_02524 [Paenimyroides aquimaris]